MEDIVLKTLLFDFYGELLNEHQREIYEDAVFGDLSLAEIAEQEGTSRQAVQDILKRCENKLTEYENKLHLIERFELIKGKADLIYKASGDESIKKLALEIIEEM